jgi:hypothetical protein
MKTLLKTPNHVETRFKVHKERVFFSEESLITERLENPHLSLENCGVS